MTPAQESKLLQILKDAVCVLEAKGVKPKKKGLNKKELFIQMSKYKNPARNRA